MFWLKIRLFIMATILDFLATRKFTGVVYFFLSGCINFQVYLAVKKCLVEHHKKMSIFTLPYCIGYYI